MDFSGNADSSTSTIGAAAGYRFSEMPERTISGTGHSSEAAADARSKANGQRNRKGLLGLSNLGNTCFMNAALQCLTHSHGLQKYFRLCSHVYTSKSQSSRQKLLMAFAHWFERDWGKNVSAAHHVPEDIMRAVQQLNPTFQGYQQQDSQEFLRCVLDNMHEELRVELPDDLAGHLMQRFGLVTAEPAERLSSPTTPAASTPSQSRAAASATPVASRRGFSHTRPFMLCQNPQGADDGEIKMQTLQSEVVAFPTSTSSSSSPKSREDPKSKEGADAKDEKKSEPSMHFQSIVSELFQSRVVSMVRCVECGRTSRTTEPMYDVSVPIPGTTEQNGTGSEELSARSGGNSSWTGMLGLGKVKSWFYDKGVDVTDCFRKYCATEYLTGKDKYFCEHCKRKNDCEKRIAFRELPEVLCIHIKRFRYDSGWFNGTKNTRVVSFPVTRSLDMSPFLDDERNEPAEYRLIGLIQHIGSMGGGHYISYCQHKRKLGEWFEFDDLTVSPVSTDQVERAEPYVLFYQRIASKGSKHDRMTFKADHRRVTDQIRTYLLNHYAELQASGETSPMKPQLSQVVADEIRHQGPALRNVFRHPLDELNLAFVTKHWYVRLTTMSTPGPVDNYQHLCPHQLLGSSSVELAAEPFVPISRSFFQSLVQKYGGGPAILALDVCPRCQVHLKAYNDRKHVEFDLVSKYDTKDTGDGRAWYLIDVRWVSSWKRYVRADHVTDIGQICPPGPITNAVLFEKEQPDRPRSNLKLKTDYIGVNARVWWLFVHLHGGGPAIVREELDIYSGPHPLETKLVPDELKDAASDLPCRLSRQFVDECLGSMEMYEDKYGAQGSVLAETSQARGSSFEAPVPSEQG